VVEASTASAGKQLANGAAWMIALRWVMRSLNFVVVIVLARVLAPDDFGIFAIALMVLGIIELIGEGGVEFALIRQDNASDEYFGSAWALQIILGLVTGVMVFVSAPFVAAIFNEPRAELVLQILSLRSVLLGFTNIGIVCFLKDFEFHKEFAFSVVQGITEGLVTIGLTLLLRDYMALVLGSVFAAALTVLMSYVFHPYRPRFSLKKVSEIWSYSSWLVVADLAEEAVSVIDRMVVGIVSATSTLGLYHMAASVGNTMFESTIFPLWRGLFPSYARMARFPRLLAKAFLAVFGWVAIIACAASFGIAAIANELILGLLGDKWADAVPLVPWLTLATGITALVDNPLLVLTALGHTRLCAMQALGRLILLAVVLPIAALVGGIEVMAIALFVVTLVYLPVQIYYFLKYVPVTFAALAGAVRRPLLSGIAMFLVVRFIADMLYLPPLGALFCEAAIGGVVFAGVMFFLWALEGKPSGPESELLSKVMFYFKAHRRT
jgi:lipopolysaccharide exporter